MTTLPPVRLSFPQGEHRDVIVEPGEVTIGSASDNTVVLAAEGIRPHHAAILVDDRGFTLRVRDQDAWTHVNARPVKEIAILRLGDIVSLQSVNIVLKPDQDASIHAVRQADPPTPSTDEHATAARQQPPRAVLRGVSGPFFGKVVAVQGKLVIGRGSDCDLVLDEPEMSRRHAQIEINAQEIFLRDLGSSNGTFVNGVQVKDATLYSGDQLAFDRNRFLIEAPGMPTRKYAEASRPTPSGGQPQVTQTLRAIRLDDTPRADTPAESAPEPAQGSFSPWWLIGAAALVAGGIALLLLGLR